MTAIITTQQLTNLESIFSGAVSTLGVVEDLAVIVFKDTYYAIQRKHLDAALDAYHFTTKERELFAYAFFVFQMDYDRTVQIIKSRIDPRFLGARLSRHGYSMFETVPVEA